MPPKSRKKKTTSSKKGNSSKTSATSRERQNIRGGSQDPPPERRRSRRISGEGVEGDVNNIPTPTYQTTETDRSSNNTERDLLQSSPSSDEKELIRNGIHPITKLEVKNCICSNPKDCRAIMWRHAAIGNLEMFYASLPTLLKKQGSESSQHVNGYRGRSFLHLYGVGNRDVEIRNKNLYIAFHHYPKEYRHILQESKQISKKLDRWRVPVEIGKTCNPPLTKADLCDVGCKSYFAVPILSNLDSAYAEIARMESEHNERLKALKPLPGSKSITPKNSQIVVPGRKSPKERQIDIKERDAQSNPRAIAIRLQDREDEIAELQAKLKRMEQDTARNEQRHKSELELQNQILTEQMMSFGLNRLSILNDSLHEEKAWLSKYLFGRPWRQHVDIAKSLFEVDKPSSIAMDEQINEFEKYCICCMIARRGYTQHTAAAIYDVDRSSISRYMKRWMPMLGSAGGDCSELDLVMSHNLFSKEYCIANDLPYMENGVAYNLKDGN